LPNIGTRPSTRPSTVGIARTPRCDLALAI
jgi:hypothetical protein